jgi:fido (protein-threonine AMPylation protein)
MRRSLRDHDVNLAKNKRFYIGGVIMTREQLRLVNIHCFPNGNGRHSRLMADIVIEKIFKKPVYTWGTTNLIKQSDQRTAYIRAIKEADNGNIQPLINFARA